MARIITSDDFKSSQLVAGFQDELRVARVELGDPARFRELLPDQEWQQATAFEGGRRVEHLAGRAAARIALEALIGPSAAVIARADDGAPEIRGIENPPLVSISHSRRAAVAVVGHVDSLGIDLCDHEDAMRVRRVAVRFMRPDEVELADNRVGLWVSLWALKEAAAKALRRGLLDGGLRVTWLASIEPAAFWWPQFEALVVRGSRDAIAVVCRR